MGVRSEHDAVAGASALRKRVVSLVDAVHHLKVRAGICHALLSFAVVAPTQCADAS